MDSFQSLLRAGIVTPTGQGMVKVTRGTPVWRGLSDTHWICNPKRYDSALETGESKPSRKPITTS